MPLYNKPSATHAEYSKGFIQIRIALSFIFKTERLIFSIYIYKTRHVYIS